MAAKQAIRDVSRVLNIPLYKVDALCKFIPTMSKDKLSDIYQKNESFRIRIDSDTLLSDMYKIAIQLEGFPRHTSSHAAGIVMSQIDLDEVIPLVKTDTIYLTSYPMEYLDKIRLLCEEKGIELVFVKAPSLFPHWYDEWEAQVDEYAQKYNITYYNFLELAEEIGIDYTTDTYDAGMHMNLSGAEKMSDYIGKKLIEVHGVTVRNTEERYVEIWEPKLEEYYEGIREREEELN